MIRKTISCCSGCRFFVGMWKEANMGPIERQFDHDMDGELSFEEKVRMKDHMSRLGEEDEEDDDDDFDDIFDDDDDDY